MDEEKIHTIQLAKSGDKAALERLIKQEEANIFAVLFYLKKDTDDIKDIIQDVLYKLAKNISRLKNPGYFKTWLNQIIVNSYYDFLRKNKKYSNEVYLDNTEEDKIFEIPDYSSNPQESILGRELDFVIKTSIDNLPLHYKIPITLREIQGLSYDEISNITKTSLGTVKSRIARARALIKDDINKYVGG